MIENTSQDLLAPDFNEQSSFVTDIKKDYYLALLSREASLMGRKEVLSGKAKFGILGDGKELPQLALAHAFQKGDWRSGYYRDQTFAMAIGECDLEHYFAQLYADTQNDPWSGGRQMNNHFMTSNIDSEGNWLDQKETKNISSDISPTAGQMARGLGLAIASKKYKQIKELQIENNFSRNGSEVTFCTIGDASTSEGVFWEVMNAAAVEQVPLVCLVWDDGYGISVPTELQTIKGSISKAMGGFETESDEDNGLNIYTVKGWDYPDLIATIQDAADEARFNHRPALVHVTELTQPQGHSTSGSHERYKSEERLEWEKEHDGIKKLEAFLLLNGFISQEEVDQYRIDAREEVKVAKVNAWKAFSQPILNEIKNLETAVSDLAGRPEVDTILADLKTSRNPSSHEVLKAAERINIHLISNGEETPTDLSDLISLSNQIANERYHTHLYCETDKSPTLVPIKAPEYSAESPSINGYQVLNKFFDAKLEENPFIVAFGEDVGYIGDVNQGFAGLQDKYGEERVFDTGIREWSIMGTAIGAAMRGLRPIAEIQYLDYLIYGLSPLSDDLSTMRYRTNGKQIAPAIIRTRGHRLEGIWHAGSPLGMMLNTLNGMHICVPRNMVQAAGMYNTLLQGNDPAIVIECLNGYRLKETLPDNYTEFTVPLGSPEILNAGDDVTIVTYGSCVREVEKALALLEKAGVSVELIDVQTLFPFDLEGTIVNSLKKTNRILFVDEDVPSGGTAYMMKEVIEKQGGYKFLDAQPSTLSAHAHRTPFGSDGDYFTKPNPETIFHSVWNLINE